MPTLMPTLSDAEVRRCAPPGEEAGFGALATARGNLPLQALDVQVRIDGLLAQTDLRQTFVNALDTPLEATYIFPLPDRAAVTRFRMEVAGRIVEGVLKERGEARQLYDQAIEEGRRAAITEEERPGVFTLRVGNLMPGEAATIHLTMTGSVAFDDGEATYRFPLVVAPRYIPGVPLPGAAVGSGVANDTDAVPDASRITPPVLLPGFPNPVRLSLSVDLRGDGLAIQNLRSSLHSVIEEQAEGGPRVRLQPGERLDRDFILRYRLATDAVQTALILYPDQQGDGKEGTFALTVIPPKRREGDLKPRDIIFVLDRSGSMGGWKMTAARRAVARMIDSLSARDRFQILAFDDAIESPKGWKANALSDATDRNRYHAVEFLAKVDARNGTEMARPLIQAAETLAKANHGGDRNLVLITDGQVGNEDQVLRELSKHAKSMRFFTLGIDQAVNAAFLRRLADLGGGLCELVESEDRLDEVMDKIHARLGAPVLTELHVEPTGWRVDKDTLVPQRLPDLFAAAPLVIQGRYRDPVKPSVTLQGLDSAGKKWTKNLEATQSANQAVAAVWARGRVRELEDRYACHPEDRLEKEIVATSLRFKVLCRFTAFLAVDVQEIVNPDGKVHRVTQPVEFPAGWVRPEECFGLVADTLCCMPTGAPSYMAPEEADEADSFPSMTRASRGSFGRRYAAGGFAPPPAQASSPAPTASQSPGFLSRLLGSVFGKGEASSSPPSLPGHPLPPSFDQARDDLLQLLKDRSLPDPRAWLLRIVAGLQDLIDRMAALRFDAAAIDCVKGVFDEGVRLLRDQAAKEDVERFAQAAEAKISALLKSPGDTVAPVRKDFWKA